MSILDTVLGATDMDEEMKTKLAQYGITPEIISEIKNKYLKLNADGNITKEEILNEVKLFAETKGISSDVFDKVMGMLGVGGVVDATTIAEDKVQAATDTLVNTATETAGAVKETTGGFFDSISNMLSNMFNKDDTK